MVEGMIGRFRFRMVWPYSATPLRLLAALLTISLMLNTAVDVDCLRLQQETCCCAQDGSGLPTAELADTCTHCADQWPAGLLIVLPAAPHLTEASWTPAGRAFHSPHPDRPPIFA